MMGMVVGYWHKEGLDIYRYVDKKPAKLASGNLDELKPIRGISGKKVLIVGKDLLLHTRKRYPPASGEKLAKAVGLEIGDIFPLSKPAFHSRVFESSSTHTLLDIWVWEGREYARLKEVFPFNYIVPEDLAYSSDLPEVKIFQYRGMIHILAHSGDRFLAGTSYPDSAPDSAINEREVERFLSSLGRYRPDIKRIKVYGLTSIRPKDFGVPEISNVPAGDYPPCIDGLLDLNLKEFRVKGESHLSLKMDHIFRVFLYLLLGYGLMLYLTERNYDLSAGQIRQKIRAIDAKMSPKEAGQKAEDYSEIIREVNDRLTARYSPLKAMDTIAQNLPMGSFILRMALNEKNLEVFFSSKEPLALVRAIGAARGIKTVQLKGAPLRDAATGLYRFVLVVELSG